MLAEYGAQPIQESEPDKRCRDNYKCVAVYGDGLAFAMEDPETFFDK